MTSNEVIANIFENTQGLDIIQEEDNNKRIDPREKYLGFKFRKEMNELITQLTITNCHFIRCIKPNELKKAFNWN